MPRETLKALEGDVKRLLIAGGALAAADEGLQECKKSLDALSSKVPVLAKVSEQVQKVLASSPKSASSELLNLSNLLAQLRAAQASPDSPSSSLSDPPSVEPIETGLSAEEADLLWVALTGSREGRDSVIEEAFQKKRFRDLRLLRAWVALIEDASFGDRVLSEALPVVGQAALGLLKSGFSLPGRAADARRLRGIVFLEGKAAEPLVLTALEEGSSEVKEAAIKELGGLNPQELLARLPVLRKEKSASLQCALVVALAKSPTDEALEFLLKALLDEYRTAETAESVLPSFMHPKRNERLLALFTPDLITLTQPTYVKIRKELALLEQQKTAAKAAKASKKTTRSRVSYAALTPKEKKLFDKRYLEYRHKQWLAWRLVKLAGDCKIVESLPLLLQILSSKKENYLLRSSLLSLIKLGDPGGLSALAAWMKKSATYDLWAPTAALFEMEPAQTYDFLAQFFSEKALNKRVLRVVIQLLGTGYSRCPIDSKKHLSAEPRWMAFLERASRILPMESRFLVALCRATHFLQKSPEELRKKLWPILSGKKLETPAASDAASQLVSMILGEAHQDAAPLFSVPGWDDFIFAFLGSKANRWQRFRFMTILADRQDARVIPALLGALLEAQPPTNLMWLLQQFQDPRIAPALVKRISRAHKLNLSSVYQTIQQQKDPSVIPALQKLLAKKKRSKEGKLIQQTIDALAP